MAVATTSLKGLQLLIDRIKRMVEPGAVIANDDLVEAFNDYEEAIREANDRLRECDELLREGHRAQALQHCEQEPDLLQVVAVLDFPERPLWHVVLQEGAFSPPPPVQLDIAAELNQAYNLEKPLTDLMRAHRLHALAGSPLKTRLGYLRKIAERDSTNPIWGEDVRTYERARHRQIEQELLVIERSKDVHHASQLDRELTSSDWDEPPPRALVESASQVHAELRQARARVRLTELAAQLHDTLGSRDEDSARQLRQAWNAQVAIANMPTSDPVFEQVEPVFDWLDRTEAQRQKERNHKAGIAALEAGLDSGLGRIELERRYNEVTRYGDVPETLNRKVQLRVEYLERRSRMRWMAGVALSLMLIGISAAGIVWYTNRLSRAEKAQSEIASLGQLIEKEDLEGAGKRMAELKEKDPEIYGRPEIHELERKLVRLKQEEQDRIQKLERLITNIEANLEDGSWEKLDQARNEMNKALDLCRNAAEERRVKELDAALSEATRRRQVALDAEFTEKLNALSARINSVVERVRQAASPDDRANLGQLKQEAENLGRTPRVTPALSRQTDPLVVLLDRQMSSIEERRQEQQATSRVRGAVGNLNAFTSALDSYAKNNPQSARGAAFAKLLQEETSVWQSVEAWNALVTRWTLTDFRYIGPQDAKNFTADLDAAIQAHGSFPATPRLQELLPFLDAVQQRVDGEGNRIHKRLKEEVLPDPRISKIDAVIADGQRYYLTKDKKDRQPPWLDQTTKKDDPPRIRFFYDLEPKLGQGKSTQTSVPLGRITNPRQGGNFDWLSPQSRFAQIATKALDDLTDKNWEGTIRILLLKLDEEKAMEPVVKLLLIEELLDFSTTGSHCLRIGFQPWLNILSDPKAKADIDANWIEPNDPNGKNAREKATETLERLYQPGRGLNECIAATVAQFNRLQPTSRGPTYQWVGCMLKDHQDRWVAECPRAAKDAAGPLVVLRKDASGAVQARKIGAMTAGAPQLDREADENLWEGRPVYFVKEK